MKSLRDALQSEELTLTAELSLGPTDSIDGIVRQARELATASNAVQIPDHRHARPHVSNLAIAAMLVREHIDCVVHMNCRDRNRIALQSDLLGLHALGVRNVLLQRGAEFPADHRPPTTAVYDIGAIDLVRIAAALRDGDVLVGDDRERAADLFVGTVATVFDPPRDWEPEKLARKADAGAQFIQLQPCLDLDMLAAYVEQIVAAKLTWRFQLLACLPVLASADAARELRAARPDAIIPAAVVERLEGASDPRAEGIAMAAEQLRAVADLPGIAGITLLTPGPAELIPAAVEAAGLRE